MNVNEYKLCEFCTISPTILSVGRLRLLAIVLSLLPELLFVVLNLSNASCLNHKVYEVISLNEKHAIISSQQTAFFEAG